MLICDAFSNSSLHHAAPLPLACHLPSSCWEAEVEWGGKELCVRFCIAISKACRAERWFDSSIGSWGPQAVEQLFIFSVFPYILYHNRQLCLPHGLYHVFPCECQPFLRHTVLHLVSALTQDENCYDFQLDGGLREDSGCQNNIHWSTQQALVFNAWPRAIPIRCFSSNEFWRSG